MSWGLSRASRDLSCFHWPYRRLAVDGANGGNCCHTAAFFCLMATGPALASTARFSAGHNPSMNAASATTNSGPMISPLMSSTNAGLRPS